MSGVNERQATIPQIPSGRLIPNASEITPCCSILTFFGVSAHEELLRREKKDRDFLTAGFAGLRLVGEADVTGFVSTAARRTNPGYGGWKPPHPRPAQPAVGKLRNRQRGRRPLARAACSRALRRGLQRRDQHLDAPGDDSEGRRTTDIPLYS